MTLVKKLALMCMVSATVASIYADYQNGKPFYNSLTLINSNKTTLKAENSFGIISIEPGQTESISLDDKQLTLSMGATVCVLTYPVIDANKPFTESALEGTCDSTTLFWFSNKPKTDALTLINDTLYPARLFQLDNALFEQHCLTLNPSEHFTKQLLAKTWCLALLINGGKLLFKQEGSLVKNTEIQIKLSTLELFSSKGFVVQKIR